MVPSTLDFEAFARSTGGWKGTIDAEKLIRDICAVRVIDGVFDYFIKCYCLIS